MSAGNHAVHGDEIGIIPGGNGKDDAERFAAQEAIEAGFRPDVDVAQRFAGDRDHVPGALQRAAHLARCVADGPSHLPAQLIGDLVAPRLERLTETRQDGRALCERQLAPIALRQPCAIEGGIDVGSGRERSLDVDAAVDGGDCALSVHVVKCLQMISKYRESSQSLMCLRNSRSSHSRVAA